MWCLSAAMLCGVLALPVAAAHAQPNRVLEARAEVLLETTQTTTVGQSIFVLGDLPELGGSASDVRKSIKMEPSGYPVWRLRVSLPAGRAYTVRFYRRDDGPGRAGDSTNGVLVAGPISGVVPSSAPDPALAARPARKVLLYHSGFAQPVMSWREAGATGAYTQTPMAAFARGRSGAETRWIADGLLESGRAMEFFITNAANGARDPLSGVYTTDLDVPLLQAANLFAYVPDGAVRIARADYVTSNLPSVVAPQLGNETRRYRVWLPRGYDVHTTRRYPVLYLHDGQNVFDAGAFGSWNADESAAEQTRLGRMREVIMVGVDNGPNRISDYAAPESGGNAQNYTLFMRDTLKPIIDAQYRTLPQADETGTLGSSMGGQVSLYQGWDFPETFRRVGAFSGAWSVFSAGFYNRVRTTTVKPPLRVYIDSGDAGTASDNYWQTMNLRDALISKGSASRFVLEQDLRYALGQGHQHNEAAWSARLPESLRWMWPAREDEGVLLPLATGAAYDVNGDGAADVEDLYVQATEPRDVNLDGVTDEMDIGAMLWWLRRDEGMR